MFSPHDERLLAELRRQVDRYRSAVNDQQNAWVTSARLAIDRLSGPGVDEDDRRAGRALLRRIHGGLS